MYIKKKPILNSALKQNQKPKSVQNLISIIQNTISTPKSYSVVYHQFFEILNKVISIQLKLVNNTTKEDNLMPKYKKYLEAKVSSFFQSIRPITPSLQTEKSTHFKAPKKAALGSRMNRNSSLNQEIPREFRKISTSNRLSLEKPMNKSNSLLNYLNMFPVQVPTSNRLKSSIETYLDRYDENNKAGSNAFLLEKNTSHNTNPIAKHIKYQDYSVTTPNGIAQSFYCPTCSVSKARAKSKSILKTYSQTNINRKNLMVKFRNNSAYATQE